jgi:hypothetical protein
MAAHSARDISASLEDIEKAPHGFRDELGRHIRRVVAPHRSRLAGRHEGNLQWQAHFEHTSDVRARFETNLTSKRANQFFDNR